MSMLQDLAERPREVSEVLLLECRLCLVAKKVERGQKRALGKRTEKEVFVVAGAGRHACNEGIEQEEG